MTLVMGTIAWDRHDHALAAAAFERGCAACAPRPGNALAAWREPGVNVAEERGIPARAAGTGDPRTVFADHVVVAADARLDNREDLVRTLGLSHSGASLADGALIAAAYERWGETCAAHLDGDFAFALWDRRRRRLYGARDRFGVRPFYFAAAGHGVFAWASRIAPLLALPSVSDELCEERVADHIAGIYLDEQSTFFRGVRRLPPAYAMVASSAGVSLRRYWALEAADPPPTSDQAAERFRELFSDAVRARLRDAQPVGCALSGGLDSSAVAGVAARQLALAGQPLHCISQTFEDVPASDEQAYMRSVVEQHGNIVWQRTAGDRLSPFAGAAQLLDAIEEPPFAGNPQLIWASYAAARARGVRVLLDGEGGDEVVSRGEGCLTEWALRGKWRRLASEVGALGRVAGRRPTQIARAAILPLVGPRWRSVWLRVRGKDPTGLDAAINPTYAKRMHLRERLRAAARGSTPTAQRAHRALLSSPLAAFSFDLWTKAGDRFGIDARHPFFDRRLAECCLSLPAELRLSGGLTRVVMRRGLRAELPAAIRHRATKTNLEHSLRRSLLLYDRGLIESVIFGGVEPIAEYFDLSVLRRRHTAFVNGGALHSYPSLLAVWLAIWFRRRRRARPPTYERIVR